MTSVSTHVLDTAAGRPAAGVAVRLESDSGKLLGDGRTDGDGRLRDLSAQPLQPGTYRLVFSTGDYYEASGTEGFYPEVVVTFRVRGGHYHVPLLLSPFGYSTYRGS